MLTRQQRKTRFLLGLSDIVLTTAAFAAAYQTRLHLPLERVFFLTTAEKALVLVFAWTAWIAVALWSETYDRVDTGAPRVILRDAFRQSLIAVTSVVLFQYLLRFDISRPMLAFFGLYSWILLCLFRLTAPNLLHGLGRMHGPHHVLVVGTGDAAVRLGFQLECSEAEGISLLGFLAAHPEQSAGEIALERAYPVFPRRELRTLLRKSVVDEIVFAVSSRDLADLEDVFLLCDEEGVKTRVAVDFFPHVHSSVALDRLGQTPVLTFTAGPTDEVRLLLKRLTDIVLAAAALILLAPAMAAISLLVRATSRGPAIFRQTRCGLNGRPFTFYKFRSMCENAEELKASLMHLNERQVVFKIRNDPRLTPIGRFLRRFSIDEWPQLWNVLRGDMSMVGPRPAVPDEVARYEQWQRRRLRMRPGLTCLWAVEGRDAVDFETWMRLDMRYIDTWSLGLDWKILLKTIPRVLSGRGAS
ncbi:MAG: sugar transferase [Bryobacterales bacterium]|nr:sugar transferase [Bryobacterales bacterium]